MLELLSFRHLSSSDGSVTLHGTASPDWDGNDGLRAWFSPELFRKYIKAHADGPVGLC
jgi:hypothetical protein